MHQKVSGRKWICNKCNKGFTGKTNLAKHNRFCSENGLKEQYEQIIKEKDEEIKKIKLISQLEKENAVIKEKCEIYKEKCEKLENDNKENQRNFNRIVEKQISAFSFIASNYVNAPDVKEFSSEGFCGLLNDADSLADKLIHHFKHKKLAQFIGDVIVKEYKKERPEDQSIWNTDFSRLVYVIKQTIDNISAWHIDKGGVQFIEIIVAPILIYVKDVLRAESVRSSYDIRFMDSAGQIDAVMEKLGLIAGIVRNIDDGILAKEIVKYCSSYFHLKKRVCLLAD